MDNELLLFDRINVIKDTITKYGEENFYLSFSGGKDSTILHYLLDMALPNNQIPRVFINTGIEYQMIVDFVKGLAAKDDRFIILQPKQAIKPMLEKYGYPFKSKQHAHNVSTYQRSGKITDGLKPYLYGSKTKNGKETIFRCPKELMYQFTENGLPFKVSDLCCKKMKKEPIRKWEKASNRHIVMTGMRKEEGGSRLQLTCVITDKDGNVKKFHPLAVVNDEWENWFIESQNITLCPLYYQPYNFKRTGCKGCPFTLDLQEQLEIIDLYLPNERKQCELIWKPVYDEYRRLNYRLKKVEKIKLF